LDLRQRELDRATQLLERDVGASSVVEDAEVGLALAQLEAERAETARELAGIEVRQAEALLDRRTITSPVDALVVAVAAAAGEYLSDQAPMMTLAVVDPLHVEVFVPSELYGRIASGERYIVTQAAPLTGQFEAQVTVVDPIFDAASGTFGVRLELANPEGIVPAGTRCLVDFGSP
jgi:multidrug efflux pump subunit AcrA (membrane-fusion protein)